METLKRPQGVCGWRDYFGSHIQSQPNYFCHSCKIDPAETPVILQWCSLEPVKLADNFWSIQPSKAFQSFLSSKLTSRGKWRKFTDCSLPPEGQLSYENLWHPIPDSMMSTDLCISNELVPPPLSGSLSDCFSASSALKCAQQSDRVVCFRALTPSDSCLSGLGVGYLGNNLPTR